MNSLHLRGSCYIPGRTDSSIGRSMSDGTDWKCEPHTNKTQRRFVTWPCDSIQSSFAAGVCTVTQVTPNATVFCYAKS